MEGEKIGENVREAANSLSLVGEYGLATHTHSRGKMEEKQQVHISTWLKWSRENRGGIPFKNIPFHYPLRKMNYES